MAAGQANVKRYNRKLCKLIHEGEAQPSFLVSHELQVSEAPTGYL